MECYKRQNHRPLEFKEANRPSSTTCYSVATHFESSGVPEDCDEWLPSRDIKQFSKRFFKVFIILTAVGRRLTCGGAPC